MKGISQRNLNSSNIVTSKVGRRLIKWERPWKKLLEERTGLPLANIVRETHTGQDRWLLAEEKNTSDLVFTGG